MPQKAVKEQVVANFLTNHPVPGNSKLYDDLPNEIVKVCTTHASLEEQVKQLFFNGTSRTGPGEILSWEWVVLVSPCNYIILHAFSLTEPCSNNVAEYNALLIGMQLAEEIDVKHPEEYGDSKLIVNQVRGEYKV